MDDIPGSVNGAVWYGVGQGPMLVKDHQQGSDVVQAAKNPKQQTSNGVIGNTGGWLMGALPLLDADREWFFDKETGDLYLQLADGIDPNEQRIIARTNQHGPGESGAGLKILNSDGWIFDGINLFATSLTINNTRDLEFKNSKILHPGYTNYMLSDTSWPGSNIIRSSSRLKFTNNEFAYNYGTLIEYGKNVSSLIFKNNNFHDAINHMWGNNGGPIVRHNSNVVSLKNTVVGTGFGGLGRPGSSNQIELNHIGKSWYDWDTGGITINQGASDVVVNRNWIYGHTRNGLRFDGHPAGIGRIASHNVAWQNGVALKTKGDQHKIHNNTAFANGDDLAMWEVKFYGYQEASGGPSVYILSNSEKYKNDSYDNIEVVRSFEIDDYKKDNYGAEISGYLTPKQDADYIFYLSSNDHSELWLSSNEDINNLVLVAKRDGVTKFRDYDAGGTESTGRSVSISLEAGKRYAIKALLRGDTGSDHLSVSWGFAGEAAPTDGAEPIASEYLSYDLGENNTSGLQQSQVGGLIVKYYETVGETYETGRTIWNRVSGRGLDQDGNKLPWKGNHLSVAHNNAINSGINPIKNPDDRTNNSGWGHRGGHVWDELRDWGNYDFRPKEGSAFIDAGIAIEGFTIPFDGVSDGIVGAAPDIGAYEYGDSQYWIPGHQEEKASFPIGARDKTLIAKPDLDLIWQEGLDAESNRVYFGTNPDQLEFKIEQTGNIYDPTPEENEILSAGQTYYWRIDTKKLDDSIVKGDTWQFTVDTRPQQIEIESVYVDYQDGDHQYLVPKIHDGKAELSLPTYGYYISKYEITNSQYAAFLNEVAQYVNVGDVWDSRMQIGRESDPSGSGGYIYTPVSGKENHPVTYVSWASATRFSNWMSGEAGSIYGGNLNGFNKGYTQR